MLNCKVIVNPASGRGRGSVLAGLVKKELSLADADILFSETLDEAREQARRFAVIGVNPVIAVGGDGILNAVLNGVLSVSSNVSIGFIPAGMSNVAANSLGIPQELRRACRVVRHGRVKKTDVGRITSAGFEKYFISMVDFGVTADIVRLAESNAKIKRFFGKAAHVPAGFCKFIQKKKFFSVSAGGESFDSFQVIFSNGKFWGGKFFWDGGISIEDGLGDVFIFRETGFFKLLGIFGDLRAGKREKGIIKLRVREIEIKSPFEVPFQADGEFLGFLREAKVEVIPETASFIVPPPEQTA
ncbi:MAG: diacylglycerol kinase family protein [bacterium]